MATPDGWEPTTYGTVFTEMHERRGSRLDLPVLSVTKTRGPMLASERFGKALHGRDLAKYRVARRGTFVADPMLLWDGAIGRQEAVDCGLVSPDYRVYELAEHVASDFMRYVVRDPRMLRHYQGGARGTNVRRNRIARGDFLRIPFALPPLAEQRRIATILSAVDKVIEKTDTVIEQLQVVKKAMMQELLTRGLPGRHTRFKQTEIGEVPEEWEVGALGALLQEPLRNGYSPVCPSHPTGKWVLQLGAVGFDGFNSAAVKPAPPDDPKVDASLLRDGDLLVSRSNTRERVGLSGVYRGSPSPCSYPDLLIRLRPAERLLVDFAEASLLSDRGRAYFERSARGTSGSMVKVNGAIVAAFPVALPSLDEQREICAALARVKGRIQAESEALDALRRVKTALMSVLLTGELRVTPDEDIA